MGMFSEENAKTRNLRPLANGGKVYSLDLPAGQTCPGANICKSRVVVSSDGKKSVKDGPNCEFRCFSASNEVVYPQTYTKRQANLAKLRGCRTPHQVARLLLSELPKNAGIVRLHVSGDFYSKVYLRGVLLAAKQTPQVRWYAYTKSLHLWEDVPMKDPQNGVVTDNVFLTASIGGKHDALIAKLNLRSCKVVLSEEEAENLGLPIDHTDEHAATSGGPFAVLIHGTQPKGSKASKAWYGIMKRKGGYSRKASITKVSPKSGVNEN